MVPCNPGSLVSVAALGIGMHGNDWPMAFFIPGGIIFTMGLVVLAGLVAHPHHRDLPSPNDTPNGGGGVGGDLRGADAEDPLLPPVGIMGGTNAYGTNDGSVNTALVETPDGGSAGAAPPHSAPLQDVAKGGGRTGSSASRSSSSASQHRRKPLPCASFVRALCIPGVIPFAMALFFAKLVAYVPSGRGGGCVCGWAWRVRRGVVVCACVCACVRVCFLHLGGTVYQWDCGCMVGVVAWTGTPSSTGFLCTSLTLTIPPTKPGDCPPFSIWVRPAFCFSPCVVVLPVPSHTCLTPCASHSLLPRPHVCVCAYVCVVNPDAGGIFGGITAGFLSDKLQMRAFVAWLFLLLAIPGLYFYRVLTREVGDSSVSYVAAPFCVLFRWFGGLPTRTPARTHTHTHTRWFSGTSMVHAAPMHWRKLDFQSAASTTG